ncbi:MAG TPA: HAD-IA family hydrolase [Acidimicrobiia bacterium]|jgi:putative hydrolase of the HAD superfamily
MPIAAVIFDLGGVVFPSPFDLFAAYEAAEGLPDRFIRNVVAASADHGAWARLERNDVTFEDFCKEFENECRQAGGSVDAQKLMAGVGARFEPRPEMLRAITSIREHGLKLGALTNNWAPSASKALPDLDTRRDLVFDVVVESSVERLRKPDPRIYELICTRLDIRPDEAVFLDDLGVNLKPARELGMTTIKVIEASAALDELAEVLGFPLGAA